MLTLIQGHPELEAKNTDLRGVAAKETLTFHLSGEKVSQMDGVPWAVALVNPTDPWSMLGTEPGPQQRGMMAKKQARLCGPFSQGLSTHSVESFPEASGWV